MKADEKREIEFQGEQKRKQEEHEKALQKNKQELEELQEKWLEFEETIKTWVPGDKKKARKLLDLSKALHGGLNPEVKKELEDLVKEDQ